MFKLLSKIRTECSETDFKGALEILRENIVFKGNLIGRDFNKYFPQSYDKFVTYDVAEIIKKLQRNTTKLAEITNLAVLAINAIATYDPERALQICRKIVSKGGVSIFLLRIIYFIRDHFSDDPATIDEADKILLDVKVSNVNYLSIAIRELTSSKTDFFNIADKVQASENTAMVLIAKNFIDHVPRTEQIFSTTLSAFYSISLFDAFLYYGSASRFALGFIPPLEITLLRKFNELAKFDVDPVNYYSSGDENVGLAVFRDAFLLLELDLFFVYRTIHGSLYNSIEEKASRRVPLEKMLLQSHFADVHGISSIASKTQEYLIRPQKYDRSGACCFENSNALIFWLEQSEGEIGSHEIDFVRLMSLTRDIGTICPIHHIENIRVKAVTDELKLVATCLAYMKQKSQLKEHELRGVIQDISIRGYDSQITALLNAMYAISPSVTQHLIQTCDETFLSKLFQLIKNPNHAIEVRAEILDWYGTRTDDLTYVERAKNLRIDVQISREKGTIDDSRIYVDPVKFTQWINDHVITSITILLETLPATATADSGLVAINWDKVKTSIAPYDQVGSILLQCYEEFCTNKIYGIASYLGRRIRHGTLKGTGLNNVTNFSTDANYRRLFASKEFAESFDVWIREYEGSLDQLRDRYLHIQGKTKPDGMILRDFRSINNRIIANHMLHEVVKSFNSYKNGIELPYIITEFCWRLIEEDLSNIRKFLMEKKAKYAVFRFDSIDEAGLKHREVQEFCQDLNSVTVEKFRTIATWFNKPSIASPSADLVLLFRAVVSEIKGFFPEYSPVVIADENDFIISGGQYFVIYDALYILIYNAAKYGADEGILSMGIGFADAKGKSINISITSELDPMDSIDVAKISIQSALEGDCEDALVVEGRSGIKKLRRMEQDNYIDGVTYNFAGDTVVASFNFAIDY